MDDRRISRTPAEPPRCPVCLGDLDRQGACRGCGRRFAPPTTFAAPALRRLDFDNGPPWYGNPMAFGFGAFCLHCFAILAFLSPYALIPVGLLFVPTVIRALRIVTRTGRAGSFFAVLFGAFVSSFGVSTLAGIASVFAFACTLVLIPGGNSISAPNYVFVLSSIAASAVFLIVFVLLWPRGKTGDRPPDPEA